MVGNSLGLNYEIPQVQGGGLLQPSQAEIAAQQPFQQANNTPMLPDINQDMAYKEGINDHLFNSYATLKRFAEDMNAKGIDVTKPDYSMPGGGDLYKTYKKLEADIYMTVDDLKRESDYEKQLAPQLMADKVGYVEGFDPRTQFASQMSPQEVYFNKQLLPEVEFANKQLGESLYTPQDVKRFNETYLYGPNSTMSKLKASLDNPNITPAQKAQIQFNIDALGKAAQQTGLSQLDGSGRGSGASKYPEVGILQDVVNLSQGRWKQGTYSNDTDQEGNVVQVNRKRSGERYGEFSYSTGRGNKVQQKTANRIIDRWVKYPDGRVMIEFKPTEDGTPVPPEDVTGMAGDAVASTLIDSNPKYGSVSKMYTGAREMGYISDTGDVDNTKLLDFNTETEDLTSAQEQVSTEKRNILTRINQEQYPIELTTPTGKNIVIKSTMFGNYIEIDGKEVAKRLDGEGVIKQLAKEGYFKEIASPLSSSSTKTYKKGDKTFTIEDLQQRAKAANRSLEDYIKAAGITQQ